MPEHTLLCPHCGFCAVVRTCLKTPVSFTSMTVHHTRRNDEKLKEISTASSVLCGFSSTRAWVCATWSNGFGAAPAVQHHMDCGNPGIVWWPCSKASAGTRAESTCRHCPELWDQRVSHQGAETSLRAGCDRAPARAQGQQTTLTSHVRGYRICPHGL